MSRLRRIAAGALAAFAMLLPAAAAAQGRDCHVLRALTNADGGNFSRLGFRILPAGGVQPRAGNVAAGLSPPAACEMRSDGDISISCHWEFGTHALAVAAYDALLARVRRCLAAALPQADNGPGTAGLNVLRRHRDEIRVPRGGTDVELMLMEFTEDAAHYWVELNIEHDPHGDPIDDTEE